MASITVKIFISSKTDLQAIYCLQWKVRFGHKSVRGVHVILQGNLVLYSNSKNWQTYHIDKDLLFYLLYSYTETLRTTCGQLTGRIPRTDRARWDRDWLKYGQLLVIRAISFLYILSFSPITVNCQTEINVYRFVTMPVNLSISFPQQYCQ